MPKVTMPQLGEGVEEGTIGKWLKAVGDQVRVGDPLVEVVTDKVNAEVEIYRNADHGFAFPERPAFHKQSAELHWARLHALFARNLLGR